MRPKATFYLEAPGVTQDLLTLKWTLRAAGYAIGSTWHDSETSTRLLPLQDHWNARCAAQLQVCDALLVLSGKSEEAARELALMAGFALARGLPVIWLGSPLPILSTFRGVQLFPTAEHFRQHILHQRDLPARSFPDERRAA
jgi:hypothetical protein